MIEFEKIIKQLVPEIKIIGCGKHFFPCSLCKGKIDYDLCKESQYNKRLGYSQINYALYKGWIK